MIITLAIVVAVMVPFLLAAWSENKKFAKRKARLKVWKRQHPPYRDTGQLMPSWNIPLRIPRLLPDVIVAGHSWARQMEQISQADSPLIGTLKGVPIITSSFVPSHQAYLIPGGQAPSREDIEKMRQRFDQELERLIFRGDNESD